MHRTFSEIKRISNEDQAALGIGTYSFKEIHLKDPSLEELLRQGNSIENSPAKSVSSEASSREPSPSSTQAQSAEFPRDAKPGTKKGFVPLLELV